MAAVMTLSTPVLAALAALLAAPGLAAAQATSAPPPSARVGFEIGFGLYLGEINCDDANGNDQCAGVTEAGGVDLHANYFFTPQLGVFVDVWPMVHTEDAWSFTHNIVTIGAKVRPIPLVTLAAGVGSAQARVRFDDGVFAGESESDVVGAAFVAAGVDVVRGRGFAIDVEARVGVGFYGDDNSDGTAVVTGRNLGLGAGFTWF